MARNQGRLISPWRQTSSLFRASRTAQNIQDREMDFKWDFNMISNQDYLTYVQNRRNQQTATDDIMKWERTLRTVQREVRSDQRADAFLRISQMPQDTAIRAEARVNAYRQLAESALADGDQDAYITAITAHNNAVNALNTAREAQGRTARAASERTFRAEMRTIWNEIQDREQTLRENRENMTPGQIAAELTTINEAKAIYHQGFAEGLSQLDPDDPAIVDREQDARRFGARANEEAAIIDWETDADGNRTVPRTEVDHLGQVSIKPAEGIIRRFDRGVETWEDGRTNQRLTYQVREDGTMSLTQTPSIVANDDWFTDEASRRQFRIQRPTNLSDQHKLNQPRVERTLDDRYFEVPTTVGDQVRNIQYLLNEGRPITRGAADQALINEQYIRNVQRDWAQNVGLGDNIDKIDSNLLPQFNYRDNVWRLPKKGSRTARIPESMQLFFPELRDGRLVMDRNVQDRVGIQRPGFGSYARVGTDGFHRQFFGDAGVTNRSLAQRSENMARAEAAANKRLEQQQALQKSRDAFVASLPAIIQPIARPAARVGTAITTNPITRPAVQAIARRPVATIRNIISPSPIVTIGNIAGRVLGGVARNVGNRVGNFVRGLFGR